MAQIDLTLNIPDNMIAKFRERYPKVSENFPDDNDFIRAIVKGSLGDKYYSVMNHLWHQENKPLFDSEIDSI